MTLLDSLERLRETLVVVMYFRWPFGVGRFRVVSEQIPMSAIKIVSFLHESPTVSRQVSEGDLD